ncbi:pyridoxal phosphate-dependent aminotransferase [Candidatus Magnetomonas plexicatena]|uniref:pyridoxal phosphate-dependent aminotransferase n=1 Tax=Candidatus Magnetomonas plexicatena TaxID=2552947 RepID=UPI0011025413|nr:aminotransferase class I/II-fold pyridoxal phosphate-dependent enzyme [Nitrospirales bacterium LBB_01]
MSDISSHLHGGDVYSLSELLKIPERKIIDFSSSPNPLGVSKKVKAEIRKYLKFLNNYPDTECRRLTKVLAGRYSVSTENIICGNGSTELIYLIVRALKPQKALIVSPTFSEYERALSMYGVSDISFFSLNETDNFKLDVQAFMEMMKGNDIAFLCNPNTPTAGFISKEDMLKIAAAAHEFGCYLIVDEAFMDFLYTHSKNPDGFSMIDGVLKNPHLIVLKSFTKFYALCGLRIGAVFLDERLTSLLKTHKEPWTVNTLSQRALVTALKDNVYERDTFALLKTEKAFFEKSLNKLEIQYFQSQVNFYLIKDKRALHIYEKLKNRSILLRSCANYRGLNEQFLRVSVKTHRENSVLFKTVSNILSHID